MREVLTDFERVNEVNEGRVRLYILNMGNMMYAYVTHPDTAPDIKNPPTFNPLLGFPNGRKERSEF